MYFLEKVSEAQTSLLPTMMYPGEGATKSIASMSSFLRLKVETGLPFPQSRLTAVADLSLLLIRYNLHLDLGKKDAKALNKLLPGFIPILEAEQKRHKKAK